MSAVNVLSAFPGKNHAHAECRRSALAQARDTCERRGVRLTPLRRRVLELVWNSHEPVKAYDVLARLGENGRPAAPPTVYRALAFLRDMGLVHRIESLNAYVGCGRPGHGASVQFLICRGCGQIAELSDPRLAELCAAGARQLGFVVDSPTVEIKGHCPRCID